MTDRIKEYSEKAKQYRLIQNRLSKKRNYITTAKVAAFLLMVYAAYMWTSTPGAVCPVTILAALAAFIALNMAESRLLVTRKEASTLESIANREKDYLEGNLSQFSKGEQFAEEEHPYAKDLDLFGEESLFQAMNRTVMPGADQMLATYLKTPCSGKEEIKRRQEATAVLSENIDWCHSFREAAENHPATTIDRETVRKWTETPDFFRSPIPLYAVYILNALMALSLVAGIFIDGLHRLSLALFLIQLFATLSRTRSINNFHELLGRFIKGFGNYYYPIRKIENAPFDTGIPGEIKATLFNEKDNACHAFKQIKSILHALDNRGNALVTIVLDGLYCRDLHTMHRLDRWKKTHAGSIQAWTDAVTRLDVLMSMANYRYNHPDFAVPEPCDDQILHTENAGHPLMFCKRMVKNDFNINSLHNLFVLTGANMSGKSTFLRTIGINWVLAMTGNVVCADTFRFTPMPIYTSMRTTDNLSKGSSYFHAEITRLKRLHDAVARNNGTFIILDEILKGTNSTDKLNGSMRFLDKLYQMPVAGIIATHDLELGTLSDKHSGNFFNICFEIEQKDNDIQYDYKLRQGISRNMNATFLLEKLGII